MMTEAIGQTMNLIQRVMGSKRLWRHVEGTTTELKLHVLDARTPVLVDGKTPATEDQIEVKETIIMDYDKWEIPCSKHHPLYNLNSSQLKD